ncbi:RNA 2',3'-cyclic phosphodiesterase [Kangiella sp. HD9-110m-PIT-SAG06]|nr:RNA 2',3'-cyclic phosphodiesterase [Kangiella sp. HD9-110m-PIT-SAG06]RDX36796.1 RNA 2',3'-cyclic phosphodiesterase [Kangiella sp. HD9-110m-PIT-SAG07]
MSSIANSVKNKARLFFAIELPQELKNQLELLQQTNPVFVGRTVKPHNFHITLQFLGSVDRQNIHDLADSIEIPGIKPFSAAISHHAYYPKTEIGCVEISEGKQKLKEIKSHINRCLANAGFHFAKDKHDFRPHITLYRECQALGDIEQLLTFDFPIESFCLMESVQNEKGVYYEVIEEWPVYEPSIKEQFFGIKD